MSAQSSRWRKSSRSSGSTGNCVEIAVPIGGGALRDSKNPDGGHVQLTTAELWTSFLCAIKAGRFDR